MKKSKMPLKSTAKAIGTRISKGIVKVAQKPAPPAGFPAQQQKAYRKTSRVVVPKRGAK